MLTPEQGLRALLVRNVRVTRHISDRLFPYRAPIGTARPFLIYSRTGSTHERHMRGMSGLASYSLQLDGYADSFERLHLLRDDVRLSIDGFRGAVTVDGETISFRHLFIENDTDASEEPQAAGDEPTYHFTMDLSAMCPESVYIPTR